MVDLRKAAAIVGIYEHPARFAPDKSELLVQAESVIGALADAGLEKKDVDGLFSSSMSVRMANVSLADYMDLYPKHLDDTSVGGASFEFHLGHAVNAIAAGRIDVAVITYSTLPRSGGISIGTGGAARLGAPRLNPAPDSFEELYGFTTVGLYAMLAQRHMHLYGTTSEQLAEIAVNTRRHASMNPQALYRDIITVDDVVNSRMISDPLHLLDCCVISDGGGAVITGLARGGAELSPDPSLDSQPGGRRGPPGGRPPRPHVPGGGADRRAGHGGGGGDPRRLRHGDDLRFLHHHRPYDPGRPRLLQEGPRAATSFPTVVSVWGVSCPSTPTEAASPPTTRA